MAPLIDTFVPSSVYNSLPHIQDVASAPDENEMDLEHLRALLVKYDVPNDISIRLIHKHYDTHEGEVMAFDKVNLPAYGTVQTMKPVLPSSVPGLRGIHYFVNGQGLLQAYEYAPWHVPSTTSLGDFFDEFCRIVTERNLQHKFGLKIKTSDELDNTGWTEYELHGKRSTVMFPDGMPQPQTAGDRANDEGSEFTVTTEWLGYGENKRGQTNCKHKTQCTHGGRKCTHCRHCTSHNPGENGLADTEGLCIGGRKIEPDSPVHAILSAVIEVS